MSILFGIVVEVGIKNWNKSVIWSILKIVVVKSVIESVADILIKSVEGEGG